MVKNGDPGLGRVRLYGKNETNLGLKMVAKKGKGTKIAVVGVVVVVCIAVIATISWTSNEEIHVGDRWVFQTHDGFVYTLTQEVTAVEMIGGRDCYVLDATFDPPYMGYVSDAKYWVDKTTMETIRIQMSGEYMGYPYLMGVACTYQCPEAEPTREVGKEYTVIVTTVTTITALSETQTENGTETYIVKIEKMEEVTVPAGTFTCLKIVEYFENGDLSRTGWYSDKAKISVKRIIHGTGETMELVSYSV